MTITKVSLTDQIDISNGAHILYFYSSMEGYIDNAVAFIHTGLEQGQHVVVIDSTENYRLIMDKLKGFVREDSLHHIHFVDYYDFYCEHGTIHVNLVLQHLDELFQTFIENKISVRSWGHVYWADQDDIYNQLRSYECQCDTSIKELGILGVCIYDGRIVPAYIQNELLKHHEYFMTDTSMVRSSFYEKSDRTVVFPSLSVYTKMQSEVDFYKHKLDFVHVVSHEVRNPLTVIKAYATMLLNEGLNTGVSEKLNKIKDYVDVIDNEITHIINTEQMLSTESLWIKTEILILPLLEEVVAIMETKSRTQDLELHSHWELSNETMVGNVIGLKLIISNLLSNAIKYSNDYGSIWLNAFMDHNLLYIVIRDQGIGMSKEQTRKLFRKYEKMNVDKSGQGIGLFMVKKLVDHFAGEIDIESEVNAGTEVTLKLPLSQVHITSMVK